MSIPKISIITIARNEESTIELALASLICQTYVHWECIVIDDGSSDGTTKILDSLTDARFRVFRFEQPVGRGAARQKALSLATGRYVGTLDADDLYFTQKLERQAKVLDGDPTLTATTTGMFLFSPEGFALGNATGYFPPGLHRLPAKIRHLRIPFAATLFRLSHIGGVDYDKSFLRTEDQAFFTKMLMGKKLVVTDDFDYAYRWVFAFEDVESGLRQSEKLYLSARRSAPFRSVLLFLYTRLKRWLYRGLHALGLWSLSKRIRYRRAVAAQIQSFEDLQATCRSAVGSL